ncbi:squalene/phytoene synthase family protein [Parvibaculaceae bacterium PLY_AMNH_Bact1]|nr:squalene/phytoene synthase family protein [Parvibaculaceae bacterium PLY_AMNH_Bact1]
MKQDRFHYCLNQLKRLDHDRYLAILLTPERQRDVLAAISAFDAEMIRIPTTVSEPMLADIRFQWWREALGEMTSVSDPGHEIAAALADTLFDYGVAPTALNSLIDLRSRDLAEHPFATLGDLSDYHHQVAAQFLSITSSIANETLDATTVKTATTHLAVYGLINQIRRMPHDVASSQLCLPLDLMGQHDIDPHAVFQGTSSLGISRAIGEILMHAEGLTAKVGDLDLRSNANLVSVLLPTILRSLYIRKLRTADFDLFRQSSDIPAFRRQLRYLRVRWSKQFQG